MKALYITYDGLTDPLGQSQILPYLKGLSSNSLQWTLLSFEKKDLQDPLIKKMDSTLSLHNIQWIKVPYDQKGSLLKLYHLLWAFGCMVWRNETYDIIHVRSYPAALLGLLLKKIYRSKFIFDMRGFWPEERIESGAWKQNSTRYKFFKFCEKHFMKNADAVVVLTEKAKKVLQEDPQYPKVKKSVVIPTCVDTSHFSLQASQKIPFSLYYAGSLGTWYCLEEMLSFFQCLKTYYSQATFTLLINWTSLPKWNPYLQSKLNSISGLKIHSCSYDELPSHLKTAQLGIFFIKPLPSKKASCPTKLGEFLAMGIPLIVNKGIGDCDEWIQKERLGILVDDFTPTSYQKTVKQLPSLLIDSESRTRCVQFAQKHLSLQEGIAEYKKILTFY